MKQARFELGSEMLKKIDGIGGENVIKSLESIEYEFQNNSQQ